MLQVSSHLESQPEGTVLTVERTGGAELSHIIPCDIDHICSDSIGQSKSHGCGHHEWSRKVSLGNFRTLDWGTVRPIIGIYENECS